MDFRRRFGAKTLGLFAMLMLTAGLAWSFRGRYRTVYLPGPTSDGHYQIELQCNACHKQGFGGVEELQKACVECHGAELARANDSHPEKKFTDPRNADRAKVLDARHCVTCHREHRPELTSSMGLSLPVDYCFRCHSTIGEERKSHAGLGFETCADAGCHNFHDNRALYEDYLVKHLDEPEQLPVQRSPARAAASAAAVRKEHAPPAGVTLAAAELEAYQKSAHATSDVSCEGCHAPKGKPFATRVSGAVCAGCHEREQAGFFAGRHGMRLAAKLPAMRVADARAPMRADASERSVGCTSCHGAHAFDTQKAAVDACLGCHDDEHSRAYRGSAHERHWLADPSGRSGASCATCHLPRLEGEGVHVQHNQNDNLRPNEKMVREVCANCHGLGFTLDALADAELVRRNFRGRPARRVDSLAMAKARVQE